MLQGCGHGQRQNPRRHHCRGGEGEQIVPWTLAIREGLDVRAFAGIMMPYPVYSEIGKRAALEFSGLRWAITGVRRILRRFGLG